VRRPRSDFRSLYNPNGRLTVAGQQREILELLQHADEAFVVEPH
jgi:hypothetical protein